MGTIVLQFSVTTVLISAMTYVAGYFDFRSAWNAIWWLGIPLIVTMIGNRDSGVRALVGSILTVWGLLVSGATAIVFGIGP